MFGALHSIRETAIYIVFNTATTTNQRVYNTDIALDRSGAVVAVYHKYNLFRRTEGALYDQPPLETAAFNTEFGRFGLITCFDALFERPFLDLVANQGVKNIGSILDSSYFVLNSSLL